MKRNTCCQRADGLLKARYDSLEQAEKAATSIAEKKMSPYECQRIRGTYHLTSRPRSVKQ